jgi:hypothetical protein
MIAKERTFFFENIPLWDQLKIVECLGGTSPPSSEFSVDGVFASAALRCDVASSTAPHRTAPCMTDSFPHVEYSR